MSRRYERLQTQDEDDHASSMSSSVRQSDFAEQALALSVRMEDGDGASREHADVVPPSYSETVGKPDSSSSSSSSSGTLPTMHLKVKTISG
jgi:hypothetical protein